MKFSVDRITDGIAVIQDENGVNTEIPVKCLPDGTEEGRMLSFSDGTYYLDEDERIRRKKLLFEKQQRLLGKKKSE